MAFFGLLLVFPRVLWNEPRSESMASGVSPLKTLGRIDAAGSALLLGFSVLLSTGLQQAAIGHSWKSSKVVPLLACSVPLLLSFLMLERRLTLDCDETEPVFPWRFVQSRIQLGMLSYVSFLDHTQRLEDLTWNLGIRSSSEQFSMSW